MNKYDIYDNRGNLIEIVNPLFINTDFVNLLLYFISNRKTY